jgi:hypothetical protein
MAKKLSKLIARVTALEHALAKFLGVEKSPPTKKAKKAKPARAKKGSAKTKKKKTAKAHKPAVKSKNSSPAKKVPAKKASGKKRRMPIPTIEQLAVSGEPQFVTPLDHL